MARDSRTFKYVGRDDARAIPGQIELTFVYRHDRATALKAKVLAPGRRQSIAQSFSSGRRQLDVATTHSALRCVSRRILARGILFNSAPLFAECPSRGPTAQLIFHPGFRRQRFDISRMARSPRVVHFTIRTAGACFNLVKRDDGRYVDLQACREFVTCHRTGN